MRAAGTKSLQCGHLKPRYRSAEPAIRSALKVFLQCGQAISVVCWVGASSDIQTRLPAARYVTVTDSIFTSSRGLSLGPVSTLEIASATSMPAVTSPKTVCLPFSQ
jgi:hypothetical protein